MTTEVKSEVKERPILFSTPMVKAILEGRKTVTRSVVNPQPNIDEEGIRFPWATFFNTGIVFTWDEDGIGGENWDANDYPNENKFEQALKRTQHPKPCPYGQPGDILWVRETWKAENVMSHGEWERGVRFIADNRWVKCDSPKVRKAWENHGEKLRPNIFLPYEACRLKLRIKSIGVERLHDITEEDAIREGITPVESFDSGAGISGRQMYMNYLPWGYMEVLPKDSFQSLWTLINGKESWNSNPWVWRIEFRKL